MKRFFGTVLLFLAAAGLAACGSESNSAKPEVVATTGIVTDIAEQVAGEDADVVQLVPEGASPHDFALSAQDRQTLEEADLVAYSGAELEAGIPIDESDAPKWALADNVGELLPFEEAGAHEEEHAAEGGEDEHAGEGEDPHVWMDPTRTAAALDSLAAALAEVDPANADAYEARAQAYGGELRAVDAELSDALAGLEPDERELVTSHDALGYFADRYGLEMVATPFPASGPEAEAAPAQLADVVDAIEEHDVPAVFAEHEDDPEVLRQIAEEAGVTVEEDLLVESPGDAGSYLEMLRRDGGLISQALGGGS